MCINKQIKSCIMIGSEADLCLISHLSWESDHTPPHFIHKALPLMDIVLQDLGKFRLLQQWLGALQ